MCGIVGVLDRGRGLPAPDVFDRMVDALTHRGPDGRGVWSGPGVMLGHRRLSVLDPTPAGAQPWVDRARGLVLTYNGEIYDFRALRRLLEGRGHAFRTRCDTEVLAAAWAEWGPACVDRLRGMFAFAVYDIRARRLWLVRDHAGIKPLFYRQTPGRLVFASEAKAIVADPSVPRRVDRAALDCVMSLCYVPAPLSAFDGISQLPPGHLLEADASGVRVRRWWTPRYATSPIHLDDAADAFGARLDEAVRLRLASDVPLGAFLSGGVDSTAIVAAMTRADHLPQTFTIGFDDGSFDERAGAAETAGLLGTVHRAAVVAADLPALVQGLATHNCDMLADASMLAVDRLCRHTREHVTVALSGDGADEMMAGYATYDASRIAGLWRGVPDVIRGAVGGAIMATPASGRRYNLMDWAQKFVTGVEAGPGADHASWRRYVRPAERRTLLRERLADAAVDRYAAAFAEPPTGTPAMRRMLHADFGFYLPSDMLTKVDRASMRHGLEVRVPFLDRPLVEWTHTLHPRVLRTPRVGGKAPLRRHLARTLGPRFARRPKRGFNVPLARAFRGPLADMLLDAVRSEPFATDAPLDPDGIEALVKAHQRGEIERGSMLYVLLVIALWWMYWLG